MTRSLAIGLDGTSWNVLDPLLETGQLPRLAGLRERGAHAVLESTIPFYTGPAWSSYATASSPGAHGVYDFTMLREGGELSVARHADLRRLTYYERLAREGRRSILVNLPIDQGECDGAVIVNSWLTVDEGRRIFPLDRRERYREALAAYQNYPTTFRADLQTHLDELSLIEQRRFELARELFLHEEWDHFYLLFSAPDWLGHYATGRFLQGDADARAAFLRLYRELDGYVGWLLEHAPDATVAVLSDHGQCEETFAVHVNGLLRDLGHVALLRERPREVSAGGGSRATLRVPQALGSLRRNPYLRPLVRRAKGLMQRRLHVELVTPQQGQDVDRLLSHAFTPTTASYAVYTRDLDEAEVGRIRERLEALELPDGRPAFEGVWTFEELYAREAPPGAPTLLFAPTSGVRPSVHARTPYVEPAAEAGRGAHQRDGMLLLGGPHVAAQDLGRVSLHDVAPTLAWAMGSAVPADADGRILFEAFEPGFAEAQEVLAYEDADVTREEAASGDDPAVTERLRALGYV